MNTDQERLNISKDVTLRQLVATAKQWWSYLFSKYIYILLAGVIGGTIGLINVLPQKPKYIAEMSFALEDDNSSNQGAGLASQFGIDLGGGGGGAFYGDNLFQLMRSRSLVEKTLLTAVDAYGQRETLVELYIHMNDMRKAWNKNPALKDVRFLPNSNRARFTRTQDSILGIIHKRLITSNMFVGKAETKLNIIALKVTSEDELFSKLFAEVLVKEVSDFYIETKTKKSVKNINILQHQTDSVRHALNAALSGVAISTDINPNMNPSRKVLNVPGQRRQVDVQANQALLNEYTRNLELSKMNLRKEMPLIQEIDRPILPLDVIRPSKTIAVLIGGFSLAGITILFFIVTRFFKLLSLSDIPNPTINHA